MSAKVVVPLGGGSETDYLKQAEARAAAKAEAVKAEGKAEKVEQKTLEAKVVAEEKAAHHKPGK